jgi:hypothetical protein
MKYHAFVPQVNGDITGREQCESRKQQRNPAARQLIAELSTTPKDRSADCLFGEEPKRRTP